MQLPKDILNLIFWELEHGRDMINFSELNRRSQQIFRQNIVIDKFDGTYNNGRQATRMNIAHTTKRHGLSRGYKNGRLEYEFNRYHGQRHGTWSRWYPNGKLKFEENWHHGKAHGSHRTWYSNGELESIHLFYDGLPIEK